MSAQARAPHALPVYVQLAELLIRDIAAGRLIDGERLPPERVMAGDLNVSVGTLRKALNLLEHKALLRRVQGSGNYIQTSGAHDSVYAMFRLELPQGGGLPRAQVLSISPMDKPRDLPEFGTSRAATRIRRLRRLNDTIIAVEEIWLDRDSGQVDSAALSESLYHYYQSVLGFWIARAEDRVGLGRVPDWAPEAFPCPSGSTVGYIQRLSWSDRAAPVEYSRTWFDSDRAVYVQRLQ